MADSSGGKGQRGGRVLGRGRSGRDSPTIDPSDFDRVTPGSISAVGSMGNGSAPTTPASDVRTSIGPSSSVVPHESQDLTNRRTLLVLRGKNDFMPAKGPSNTISKILKQKFYAAWPNWKAIPQVVRDMFFREFKKSYRWAPHFENTIRTGFEHKGSLAMKNTMNKLRTSQDKGNWMDPVIREGQEQHWATPKFKEKSATARRNQVVDSGTSAYIDGTKSAAAHFDELVVELQRPPTAMELVEKTKKLKSGE